MYVMCMRQGEVHGEVETRERGIVTALAPRLEPLPSLEPGDMGALRAGRGARGRARIRGSLPCTGAAGAGVLVRSARAGGAIDSDGGWHLLASSVCRWGVRMQRGKDFKRVSSTPRTKRYLAVTQFTKVPSLHQTQHVEINRHVQCGGSVAAARRSRALLSSSAWRRRASTAASSPSPTANLQPPPNHRRGAARWRLRWWVLHL